MAGEDDLTVLIDDDLDIDDGEKVVVPGGTGPIPAVKAKAADAEDPVASLRGQLETLRTTADNATQRAINAERLAQQERDRAEQATTAAEAHKTAISESQYDTVVAGIEAAKSDGDVAERDYESAMDAGDFKKAADAQRRIARAEARIVELEGAKSSLESSSKAAAARIAADPNAGKKPDQTRIANADPVEDFISQRSVPTGNWLRQHKEFLTDPVKNKKLIASHYDAEANGKTVDTPEYFKHVEKYLGIGEQPRQRRQGAPVAPVQNGGNGLGGGREVSLSKKEATAATDGTHTWNYDDPSPQKRFKKGDPIGITEFARRKIIMNAQGAYDKSLTE